MEEIQHIKLDEKVNLAYQTINFSEADKPLLVFLHEGLGSIAQWKDFPAKLCAEMDLPGLVYDRYGYGHSTPLQEERTPDYLQIAADYYLPQFIESLGLHNRKLILIGHSDGASIALIYAALFPKNVVQVVSMAAHVFTEQISVDSIRKLTTEYERNGNLKKSLEKYHFEHTDSTFYAFGNTITSDAFRSWNIEHFLPRIEAPVLVIQGDLDEYGTEKQVDSIYDKTPHPQKERLMIPNCGHIPQLSHSKIVLDAISLFLKK